MQRASAFSVGLRSSWPPGQSTIGSSSGSTWKRSIRVRAQLSLSGIEALVRMAVAAEEVDQPEHVAVAVAADDHRAAAAALDQADAAQDQRAHDPLAKLGLGDQQRAQPVGRDDERLDRRVSAIASTSDRPPGKLRQLAHERARARG